MENSAGPFPLARRAIEAVWRRFAAAEPACDVLVANAGLALGLEPSHKTRPEDWEEMVDTDVKGLMYTVRAFLPAMVERGSGHVAVVGSVAADTPYPGGNVYGAEKAVKPYAGLKPLTGADVAEAVYWAATLPVHVNICRIEMMPTAQAHGAFAFDRTKA